MVTAGLGAPNAPGQPAGHGTGRFGASNQRPAARGGRGGRAAVEPGLGAVFGRFSMIFGRFRLNLPHFEPPRCCRNSSGVPRRRGESAGRGVLVEVP